MPHMLSNSCQIHQLRNSLISIRYSDKRNIELWASMANSKAPSLLGSYLDSNHTVYMQPVREEIEISNEDVVVTLAGIVQFIRISVQ